MLNVLQYIYHILKDITIQLSLLSISFHREFFNIAIKIKMLTPVSGKTLKKYLLAWVPKN